jgi:hypothetical protein
MKALEKLLAVAYKSVKTLWVGTRVLSTTFGRVGASEVTQSWTGPMSSAGDPAASRGQSSYYLRGKSQSTWHP